MRNKSRLNFYAKIILLRLIGDVFNHYEIKLSFQQHTPVLSIPTNNSKYLHFVVCQLQLNFLSKMLAIYQIKFSFLRFLLREKIYLQVTLLPVPFLHHNALQYKDLPII